jgi:hypothetical protein
MRQLLPAAAGRTKAPAHLRRVAAFACAAAVVLLSSSSAAMANERSEWKVFAECPLDAPPVSPEYTRTRGCFVSTLSAGSELRLGGLSMPIAKPITLSAGFEENEVTEQQAVVGSEYGENTLQRVAEPLADLRQDVESALLSKTELLRYEKAIHQGRTKVTGTIELAGPPSAIRLSEANIVGEEGTGFGLPIQIKLTNAFLGDHCYLGSNSNPIDVELTTGQSGALHGAVGVISTNEEGTILVAKEEILVNSTFVTPGATGCGHDGQADAAIDAALGLPAASGGSDAFLNTSIVQAGAAWVREHFEALGIQ